jgi:hypothetical protein
MKAKDKGEAGAVALTLWGSTEGSFSSSSQRHCEVSREQLLAKTQHGPGILEMHGFLFFPRQTCTKRNFAAGVRKFAKSLDLHKKTKTLCSVDGILAAGNVPPLSALLLQHDAFLRQVWEGDNGISLYVELLPCPETLPSPPCSLVTLGGFQVPSQIPHSA